MTIQKLALTNAKVITGVDADDPEHATVVVEAGIISWIGPHNEAVVSDCEVYDCNGKTVMAGLIDAHTHLIYNEVRDTYSIELLKSLEEATIDASLAASHLLSLGFTSVRDVGTRGNIACVIRDSVNSGRLLGPDILASKQVISTWGTGDYHPDRIFAHAPYPLSMCENITGPWEAREAVRRQAKAGVDWIKTEASGTGFNPFVPSESSTMSDEELRAIVDEAKERGLSVACHAESRQSVIRAANAGVRTVEHAVHMDDEGLEAILRNGAAICPTVAVFAAFAHRALELEVPPKLAARRLKTHETHLVAIRKALDAGVTIIAGSDGGLANLPQGSGLEEVCLYVEALDMSARDALRACTSDAASVLGLTDRGTVEAGRRADLVVFDSSPLDNIRAIASPDGPAMVLKQGVVVRSRLSPLDNEAMALYEGSLARH